VWCEQILSESVMESLAAGVETEAEIEEALPVAVSG
jgi:hypothetical protein